MHNELQGPVFYYISGNELLLGGSADLGPTESLEMNHV